MAKHPGNHESGEISTDSTKLLALLPPELKSAIEKVPAEQRSKILLEIVTLKASYHSGPLPSPEVLKMYNEIIPGGAEKIFQMAQDQSKHRMDLESFAIKGQVTQSGRGQIFGFALGLAGLIGAVILGIFNQSTAACTIGGGSLIGLVSVFVYGRSAQKKDLGKKKKQTEQTRS